jgi:RNA polymerase sigma-70 factor (ECF subfamily)
MASILADANPPEPYTRLVDPGGIVRTALSQHEGELIRFVERRSGGLLDPEEIFQSAAVRALAKAEQLRDSSHARAWLYRIVRNVIADELRRFGAGPLLSPVDGLDVSLPPDEEPPCWCVLAQHETLEPQYAEILKRVVIEGLPVKAVALELGLTPNNAMVRLHRARAALRKRMAEHCGTTTARSCVECGCADRGCCPAPAWSIRAN